MPGRCRVAGTSRAEFASPQAAGIPELNFEARDVFMVIAPEPEGAAGSAIGTAEAEPIGVWWTVRSR